MYIKNSITDHFEGFTLDTTGIGNTSIRKREIHLPYTGPLPDKLSDVTSATIAITLQMGLSVNVLLIVERAGKKRRYLVAATPDEIDSILSPLFFDKRGYTRWDTGLNRYYLGFWQSSYLSWRRLVMEHGIYNILSQLSTADIEGVLEYIRHSKTV